MLFAYVYICSLSFGAHLTNDKLLMFAYARLRVHTKFLATFEPIDGKCISAFGPISHFHRTVRHNSLFARLGIVLRTDRLTTNIREDSVGPTSQVPQNSWPE